LVEQAVDHVITAIRLSVLVIATYTCCKLRHRRHAESPVFDGNKGTGFMVTVTFLELNGIVFTSD